MTDLEPRQVVQLAELWTKNSPVGVRTGFAISHWYRGDLTMQALLTLQALTGNIGNHGGGVTTFAGGLTTTAFDLGNWWAPKGTEMFTVLEPMEACDAMLEDKPYPGPRRVVHGRQLRAADVRPEPGREGVEVTRLPRRLRLRAVGDRRPGGHRPAGLHVPREDRPALLEQLLSPVHAEGDRPALGVEVRPRGDLDGRREDGRRAVLRQERRRLPEGDPPHRRSEGGRQRRRPDVGAAHDVGTAPEHADDPVRAVLRQEVPDEVGADRVLRRDG